jgi:hypothetical protein
MFLHLHALSQIPPFAWLGRSPPHPIHLSLPDVYESIMAAVGHLSLY